MLKSSIYIFSLLFFFSYITTYCLFPVYADPKSAHYIFKDYNFGGSNGQSKSTTYQYLQTAGEGSVGNTKSTNFSLGEGLSFTLNAYVPSAPTVTNPSNFYNKLNIVLNIGTNSTDTQFAIAVSPDNFVSTTKYAQSDDTLGSSPVWQTLSSWGSSGFTLIGLTAGTTYTAKVSAMQGKFTQSRYGPTAQAATVNATLSFNLSANTIALGTLTPGTVTTGVTTITNTVSSNANNGVVIFISDTNSGLSSSSSGDSMGAVTGDLASLQSGFGIQGTSVSQSSGGPMEVLSPYNVSGTQVGTVSTTNVNIFDSTNAPVTSGQASFVVKAKPSVNTKIASDYADTITIVASGLF